MGAPLVDAYNSQSGFANLTLTQVHTCSGPEPALVVLLLQNAIDISEDYVTGVTYNGVAMTKEGSGLWAGGANCWLQLYTMKNPPTGSSYNVVVTVSAAANVNLHVVSLKGVEQAGDPFRTVATATGTSSTPSVSVTSEIGDIVLDIVGYEDTSNNPSVGSGQTELIDLTGGTHRSGTSWENGSASSTTMSWSLDGGSEIWGMMGIAIQGSSVAGNKALLIL